MPQDQTVKEAFTGFWDEEKSNAIAEICATKKLDPAPFKGMIEQYHFSGKKPLRGAIVEALNEKPKILERKGLVQRIGAKLMRLVPPLTMGWD